MSRKKLPTMTLLAEMANLVYARNESYSKWRVRVDEDIASLGAKPVITRNVSGVEFFSCVYGKNRIHCIAGTNSVSESLTNLLARQRVDCVIPGGAKVHVKFDDDAQLILRVLEEEYDWCEEEYSDWFTGHSRGAAIASILAGRVAAKKRSVHLNLPPTHLVTFESPRVGNRRWARWMDKNVPSIRVQRAGDIVPLCPLAIGGHYCHTRKPAYFDSKGRLQPGASLLTRVLEYPVAILSHIGVPGFASTALHSMSDLLAMLEKEESELNGGNLLLELMDG